MNSSINSAWSAASAVLKHDFSFYEIKEIVGLAGLDACSLSHLVQMSGTSTSKGQLISTIDHILRNFDAEGKRHFLNILLEEMLTRKPSIESQLESYLSRLGWQLVDGSLLHSAILNGEDLAELDEASKVDFVKAATRFRDGDLGGSISASCGAVDSVTKEIYQSAKTPSEFAGTSFQERCKVALRELDVFNKITTELREIGWGENDISVFEKNLRGAINHTTLVMQKLREKMSDAHGSKPALKPLVFDSMKWAQFLVRLLSRKNVL